MSLASDLKGHATDSGKGALLALLGAVVIYLAVQLWEKGLKF